MHDNHQYLEFRLGSFSVLFDVGIPIRFRRFIAARAAGCLESPG
jgi:hypothetical protein